MLSAPKPKLGCGTGQWDCYNGKGSNFCVWCPSRGAFGECWNTASVTCNVYANNSQKQVYGWSSKEPGNPYTGCNGSWRTCWDDNTNNGLGSYVCAACPYQLEGACFSSQEDTCNTYDLHVQASNNCTCTGPRLGNRWLFTSDQDLSSPRKSELSGGGSPATPCCNECPSCDKSCMGKCWCSEDGSCSTLGKLYYLPEIDVDSPNESTGFMLLKDPPKLDTNLVEVITDVQPSKDTPFSYSTSLKELSRKYSEDINIKAGFDILSFFSAKGTLDRKISNSIASTENVKTLFKEYIRNSGKVEFNYENVTPDMLDENFTRAFKALSVDDPKDGDDSWWTQYTHFLQNHGSHVLATIMYGSRLEYRESSIDSTLQTEDSLKFKACADMSGGVPGTATFNIDGCYDVSTTNTVNQKNEDFLQTSQTWGPRLGNPFDVEGKDTEERVQKRNKAIKEFLDAADNSTGGIKYNYIPVWSILEQIYSSSKLLTQRARNLKAAYLKMAYKCDLVMDGDVVLQSMKFVNTDTGGIKNYGCWNKAFGCQGTNLPTGWNNDTQGCSTNGVRNGQCSLAWSKQPNGASTAYNAEDLGNDTYRTIMMTPGVAPNPVAASSCSTKYN